MRNDDRLSERPAAPPPSLPADFTLPPPPVTIRVVAFIVLVYGFLPFLVLEVLLAAGLGPGRLAAPLTPEQTAALMRLNLLATALAFPLQVASVLLLMPRILGVRPWQIGLTFRRFGWNCLWGVVGWAVLTPACLAVNYAVNALEGAGNGKEHPLVQMAQQGLAPLEWFLLVFTATITAPAMEELLFRGALLTWMERHTWASHLAMILAFVLSVPMKGNEPAVWRQGGWPLLLHLAPVLFVLALAVAYLVICQWTRTPTVPAVFASSALFAAVHSFAWPTPVALFVLALGLALLAHRTHSLTGPILLHGLFNAVSCVLLFLPQ